MKAMASMSCSDTSSSSGAAGGVGTFAVQIAKALGAEVTGVCSTRNVEMVRAIGADHVVDYTREDFTRSGRLYDLILDNVGNRSFKDCRRVLTPGGSVIPNTSHAGMSYVVKAYVLSVFMRRQERPFLAKPRKEDPAFLTALIEGGKVTPVIDRTYPLSETPEAIGYVGEGHARGKVVISV
jgi:NADPH:quinone reductase-like Zn-dependent oxidoreductase